MIIVVIFTLENSGSRKELDASTRIFKRENRHSFNTGSETKGLSRMKTSNLNGFEKPSGVLN